MISRFPISILIIAGHKSGEEVMPYDKKQTEPFWTDSPHWDCRWGFMVDAGAFGPADHAHKPTCKPLPGYGSE